MTASFITSAVQDEKDMLLSSLQGKQESGLYAKHKSVEKQCTLIYSLPNFIINTMHIFMCNGINTKLHNFLRGIQYS